MDNKRADTQESLVADLYRQFGGRPLHQPHGTSKHEVSGEEVGAKIYEDTLKTCFPSDQNDRNA